MLFLDKHQKLCNSHGTLTETFPAQRVSRILQTFSPSSPGAPSRPSLPGMPCNHTRRRLRLQGRYWFEKHIHKKEAFGTGSISNCTGKWGNFIKSSAPRACSSQDYSEGYTDPWSRTLITKTLWCKIFPIMFYLVICKQEREIYILLNWLTGSPMSPRAPGFPFGPGLP